MLGLNDDIGVKGDRLHQDAHGGGSDTAVAGSVHGALGVQGEAELLDVLDVDDAGDEAGMNLVRRYSGGGGVVEEPVTGGLPSAVVALHHAGSLAVDGDGANHLDGPGIDDALHLDDFMTGSAYQDVEEGFDYVRGGRTSHEVI